ncbi:MAG: hypothetical protein ACKV2T_15480 [Kofleriaceae bacterium]
MRLTWVVVALVACTGRGSSPPPDAPRDAGSAPFGCEEIVDDKNDCTPFESICRDDICAAWDCCFVENGEWRQRVTDCFGGCGHNVDASVDAP